MCLFIGLEENEYLFIFWYLWRLGLFFGIYGDWRLGLGFFEVIKLFIESGILFV